MNRVQIKWITEDLETPGRAVELRENVSWIIAEDVTVLVTSDYGAYGSSDDFYAEFSNYGILIALRNYAVRVEGSACDVRNFGTLAGQGGVSIASGSDFANYGQVISYPSANGAMRPGIKVIGGNDGVGFVVNSGEVHAEVALLSSGASVQLVNIGALYGAAHLGDGNDTVRNIGEIEGEVLLGGGRDRFDGRGGTALSVNGEGGRDTIFGGGEADFLVGGRGRDVVRGGGGDDTIVGCYGEDVLKGGGGADTFVFANLKAPDRIKDFAVGEDRFHLDNAALEAVGADGALAASAFHTGRAAADDDDRIIYDPEKGKLWYDINGDDKGGATHIAWIDKGLDLSHERFVII